MNTEVMFSSATDQWDTPADLAQRIMKFMGRIDLDPCASWTSPIKASVNYHQEGLAMGWWGKVYMNPPYGREIGKWVEKALTEENIEEAILLLPARTDTKWFQECLGFPICFIKGRLKFGSATNSAPFPSALVYIGTRLDAFVQEFKELGSVVWWI